MGCQRLGKCVDFGTFLLVVFLSLLYTFLSVLVLFLVLWPPSLMDFIQEMYLNSLYGIIRQPLNSSLYVYIITNLDLVKIEAVLIETLFQLFRPKHRNCILLDTSFIKYNSFLNTIEYFNLNYSNFSAAESTGM